MAPMWFQLFGMGESMFPQASCQLGLRLGSGRPLVFTYTHTPLDRHVATEPRLVDPRVHPLTLSCSTCFYPKSVSTFDLASYLGTWYQVAGYEAIFTAGCKCVTADYTLNDDGTVGVKNQCEALGLPVTIAGSAAPVDPVYGDAGAFEVTFFNATNACPGPNYIVQGEYGGTEVMMRDRTCCGVLWLTRFCRVRRGRLCHRAVA